MLKIIRREILQKSHFVKNVEKRKYREKDRCLYAENVLADRDYDSRRSPLYLYYKVVYTENNTCYKMNDGQTL